MFILVKLVLNKKISRVFWLPPIVLALNGCAVGPDFQKPHAPDDAAYLKSGIPEKTAIANGVEQKFTTGNLPNQQWWSMFQSSSLDSLVKASINENASLKASEASLLQSQDLLQAGYGVFFPQVAIGLNAQRVSSSPYQLGQKTAGSIFNLMTAGVSVSYTLDVFGGERRQVEALQAQVDYQRYQTNAAFLMLTANVVNTSIARAAYLAQIQATKELVNLEKDQLQVSKAQVAGGTAAFATELTIQSLISSNEASIASLRQKVSQAEHLLAVLEGVDPSHVQLADLSITSLSLPDNIPINVPSDLVRTRPDILASEALMHQASANIGVATANLFPSITLSGGYGAATNQFSNLSGQNQQFWTVGPSINIPVFEGGALYFTRKAAIDAFQVAQENYRQTVLTAFSQVADCLTALENDAELLQNQLDAKNAAAQALKLQQISYQSGLVDYLSVLIADVQYHQADIAFLQALAQRYQDTVALYVAMGGGW
jgi:NodT family efflux transporter outer membrane factor (OMF) lipoprotein